MIGFHMLFPFLYFKATLDCIFVLLGSDANKNKITFLSDKHLNIAYITTYRYFYTSSFDMIIENAFKTGCPIHIETFETLVS